MWQHRYTSSLPRRVPLVVLALGVVALGAWGFSSRLWWPGSARAAAPQTKTFSPFTLTSPDFADGGPLPFSSEFNQFCHGQNIAPTLNWINVPSGTASFALEVTDYDAPIAGGFHHWIVYNIPSGVRTLNGNPALYSQGTNSFGTVGYGGPCPPPNGQLHHYIFTLYALTIPPSISGQALTYDGLISAISGHVAGATVIIGTFTRTSPSQ